MAAITGDWLEALRPEFSKPYYRDLFAFVQQEYRTRTIYPPAQDLFNALHETPLGSVRAVILGQDPYHGEGQAHGMCFSVRPGCPAPPLNPSPIPTDRSFIRERGTDHQGRPCP